MTYNQFKTEVENLWNTPPNPHVRKGQLLMNFLASVWMGEYKRIASIHYYDQTNIDCFYQDKLIPNTLKHLETVWHIYPL